MDSIDFTYSSPLVLSCKKSKEYLSYRLYQKPLDKQLYYKLFTITCLSLAFLGLMIGSISSNIYAKYDYFLKWGSNGNGPGQFQVPHGVAVDSSSNVFVADTGNHRIQQFKLANSCPAGSTQVVPGVCFVIEWGTQGSGKGQFQDPWGVTVEAQRKPFPVYALS